MIYSKIKIIGLASILFFVFFLSSCQKNNEEASEEKCLISHWHWNYERVCDDNTYTDSGSDTFTYDDNGRLIIWQMDEEGDFVFSYDNDGRLSRITTGWGGYLLLTREGNIVTAQLFEDGIPDNRKYVIELNSNNEIIRVDHYRNDNSEWGKVFYSLFTWQNGNVIRVEEYGLENGLKTQPTEPKGLIVNMRSRGRFNLSSEKNQDTDSLKAASANFVLKYLFTFTYDNGNNPFAIHEPLRFFVAIEGELGFGLFMSKNNTVSMKVSYVVSGNEYEYSLAWQYNNNNYPVHLTLEEKGESCDYYNYIDFSYLNCQ